MKEYHKIKSVFKRSEDTHKFIEGEYSLPEFEYLKDNAWVWTEKVDGTNVRVMWDGTAMELRFGGKTDNAQMPVKLTEKLHELFPKEKFYGRGSMCLYGEGYGAKIQKAGGNYNPNGMGFVLFDVKIDKWWLKRDAIQELANELYIDAVPVVGVGPLVEAIAFARKGYKSTWGDFRAEGIVLRPAIELKTRAGARIITKIKEKDFQGGIAHV